MLLPRRARIRRGRSRRSPVYSPWVAPRVPPREQVHPGHTVTVVASPSPAATLPARDSAGASAAIHAVLDDWHRAAATADEARYSSHFTSDAIFLGTDKTERWHLHAFQTFAHPFFAKGKAWNFTPVRRDVIVGAGGAVAWFDEDLDTPNSGPRAAAASSSVMPEARGKSLTITSRLRSQRAHESGEKRHCWRNGAGKAMTVSA